MSVIEKHEKFDIYATVTDKIVAALEAGTVPWHKPWDSRLGAPRSMASGKAYRGVNIFLLGITAQMHGYTSPFWGTYKNIAALGGQVRKGEKNTLVTLWQTGSREQTNAAGEVEAKRWAMLRFYQVFNACQADNLPEKFHPTFVVHEHEPMVEAQAMLDGYIGGIVGPSLELVDGNRAFYRPSTDTITVPPMDAFPVGEAFYATCFHEATHSTGHKSRLNREGIVDGHSFGDEVYSREELVAEMGAAMLSSMVGIESVIPQSAAYIQSWLKALKGDSHLVVSAAGQAQKACDVILGTMFDDA